jgi:hypothetical protein
MSSENCGSSARCTTTTDCDHFSIGMQGPQSELPHEAGRRA